MTTPSFTREHWLEQAVERLRPLFASSSLPLPDALRVSVGFPSRGATSRRRRTIGQCWAGECADDGAPQIFISPVLVDPVGEVLDTLAHELLHAAVGPECGHRGAFVSGCKAIGLTEGKPTAAGAGEELRQVLEGIAGELGDFPHARLTVAGKIKKQGTRMLKAQCTCGYVIRLTRTWADTGMPVCVCGGQFELAE